MSKEELGERSHFAKCITSTKNRWSLRIQWWVFVQKLEHLAKWYIFSFHAFGEGMQFRSTHCQSDAYSSVNPLIFKAWSSGLTKFELRDANTLRIKIENFCKLNRYKRKWAKVLSEFSTRRWVVLVARTRWKFEWTLWHKFACRQVSRPRFYRLNKVTKKN